MPSDLDVIADVPLPTHSTSVPVVPLLPPRGPALRSISCTYSMQRGQNIWTFLFIDGTTLTTSDAKEARRMADYMLPLGAPGNE